MNYDMTKVIVQSSNISLKAHSKQNISERNKFEGNTWHIYACFFSLTVAEKLTIPFVFSSMF